MRCDCGSFELDFDWPYKVTMLRTLESVHRPGDGTHPACYDEITPGADGLFRWRPTGGTGDATEPAGKIAAPEER